jgi:DNA-binding response OmpR family regulator
MTARFWLGTCLVDLDRNEVRRGPEAQRLTAREADLLRFLAASPGADVPRTTLMRDVFGYHPDANSRAVDFTVHRLRRKLEADPGRPAHLVSSVGHGYRLDGCVPDVPAPLEATRAVERPADPTLFGRASPSG